MGTNAIIAHWAADHFGVISLPEAEDLGVSYDEIRHYKRDVVLRRRHRGVYFHAAAPPTFEGELRAAVLAAGCPAWASGPSAMRLFGIRGEWSDVPEITVLGTEFHELQGVHVRRIDRLDPADCGMWFGIPVLTPPLALLGLGATYSERKVETAIHDAVHLKLTTRVKLLDVLQRYGGRGRRGTVKLRTAVRHLPKDGTATERNLELDMLRLLRANGLPEPAVQYPVLDADGRKRRLDLAYVEAKLDIETDGDRWHTMTRDRAKDRQRDRALIALGWEIQRYGSADIHLHAGRTLAKIRRSLST